MTTEMLELLKRQGFSVTLLGLAVYLLILRLESIEQRLANCESDKFKIITDNNNRSNEAIDRNTIALERNTEVFESIQAFMGMGVPIHRKKSPAKEALTARQGINR